MSSSEGVRRETVIAVLRDAGVECYPHSQDPSMTVLAKDGIIEAYDLPEAIGRSMLGRLSRKFGVQPYKFWSAQPVITDQLAERRKGTKKDSA